MRLKATVLNSPGHTPPDLRRAIESYVAALTVGGQAPPDMLPAPLTVLVRKVALHAYKVTDDDIAALKRAEYSDDAIFEIIVTAAVAAGSMRLEMGRAVAGGQP